VADIPALRRWREKDGILEASLGDLSNFKVSLNHITRPYHNTKKKILSVLKMYRLLFLIIVPQRCAQNLPVYGIRSNVEVIYSTGRGLQILCCFLFLFCSTGV
jgi:hypothetical protein